jgi:hypothetical protein
MFAFSQNQRTTKQTAIFLVERLRTIHKLHLEKVQFICVMLRLMSEPLRSPYHQRRSDQILFRQNLIFLVIKNKTMKLETESNLAFRFKVSNNIFSFTDNFCVFLLFCLIDNVC